MEEVLVQYSERVSNAAGASFLPRVCGRPMEHATLWEGWIEFIPESGAPVLRTERETEQSGRDQLKYWATGLTVTYLEGALRRAAYLTGEGDASGSGA